MVLAAYGRDDTAHFQCLASPSPPQPKRCLDFTHELRELAEGDENLLDLDSLLDFDLESVVPEPLEPTMWEKLSLPEMVDGFPASFQEQENVTLSSLGSAGTQDLHFPPPGLLAAQAPAATLECAVKLSPSKEGSPRAAAAPESSRQHNVLMLLKRYWQLRQLDLAEDNSAAVGYSCQGGGAPTGGALGLVSAPTAASAALPVQYRSVSAMPLPAPQRLCESRTSPQVSPHHHPPTPPQAAQSVPQPTLAPATLRDVPCRHVSWEGEGQVSMNAFGLQSPFASQRKRSVPEPGQRDAAVPKRGHGRQPKGKRARVEAPETVKVAPSDIQAGPPLPSKPMAALERENAALRHEVRKLQKTMRLWCVQGYVSDAQAAEFLAASPQVVSCAGL
ncbi:hypothetical protein N2152v2_000476 [Parachlorella kessleri]